MRIDQTGQEKEGIAQSLGHAFFLPGLPTQVGRYLLGKALGGYNRYLLFLVVSFFVFFFFNGTKSSEGSSVALRTGSPRPSFLTVRYPRVVKGDC